MSQRSRKARVGAYALAEYQGKYLLVRQVLGPNAGKWSLPGGGLDFGEDARAALVRELKEECGLIVDVEQAELLDTLSAQSTWGDDSGEVEDLHWIGIIFSVGLNAQSMRNFHEAGDGESAGASKWCLKEEIDFSEISPLVRNWLEKKLA